MSRSLLLLFFLLCFSVFGFAASRDDSYIISSVDYSHGLSSSAVLSICQDNSGLMWFGTYDGVSCYDGKSMEVYRSDFSSSQTLNSNIVNKVMHADDNCLWFVTHLGVNRFSRDTKQIVGFYEHLNTFKLFSNKDGDTWLIDGEGLHYYNIYSDEFVLLADLDCRLGLDESNYFVDEEGVLWVFSTSSNELYQYKLNSFDIDKANVEVSISNIEIHTKSIKKLFYQNGVLCFIDVDNDLFVYDVVRESKIHISNIGSYIEAYGEIAGIVPFYDDIIIGFVANGLFRLRATDKYSAIEVINQNIRIFDIYKDSNQGILWVASDGKGAIMYSKRHTIATNIMLSELSSNLSRQVRSIMTDKFGGLWFGTKGDGLVHIKDYNNGVKLSNVEIYSTEERSQIESYVKWGKEFSVYKLSESKYHNGFWVGSGEQQGLYFYDYNRQSLRHVSLESGCRNVEIHDVYEHSDSVLYTISSRDGFCRLSLVERDGGFTATECKRYHFYSDKLDLSMFYSMQNQGDSILWLGSREKGLVRFNLNDEGYQVISLREKLNRSVDDVLSLYHAADTLYVGTSSGLVGLSTKDYRGEVSYIGREDGLFNDMIHGVIGDQDGFMWLGTNRSLIKYNPVNNISHAFYYTAGVQIGEFSDDAYYLCPYSGRLFFGGIDGLLYLEGRVEPNPEYFPDVIIRKLRIGRLDACLSDYYIDDNQALQFCKNDSSFSLSFVAPDFLNGNNTEYSYMLDGYDQAWSAFNTLNEAIYDNLPPGNYEFKVRYIKDVYDTEFKYFEIPIFVIPLWYNTLLARILYSLIGLLILGYILYLLYKYYLQRSANSALLVAENRSMSALPNNSSREILNCFTSIYNSCDSLRAENMEFKHRLTLVESMRESVMSTLLTSTDFAMDSISQFFPDKFIVASRVSLSSVFITVVRALKRSGRDCSSIKFDKNDKFVFPVYTNALQTILYCCFLQIVNSKESQGAQVSACANEDGDMVITLSSIDDTVVQLYRQLQSGSTQDAAMMSDDMFDLSILLNFVRSAFDKINAQLILENQENSNSLSIVCKPADIAEGSDDVRPKMRVVFLEDRDEIYWLVSNLLSEEYIVCQVKSVQHAFEDIKRSAPVLFLVDMLMYQGREELFMEYVRRQRAVLSNVVFAPLLSWKVSSKIQKELILSSDTYLVLPYDILFLREVIHGAIFGKRSVKQLHIEDLGSLADQIVCSSSDQVEFVRRVLSIVEENLKREDLGSTLIADRMAMSPRNFYRKFKEVSTISPTELIKIYRMQKAAMLLISDRALSIQDVIADVGVASRSYFYKAFAESFGMTPKEYREQND